MTLLQDLKIECIELARKAGIPNEQLKKLILSWGDTPELIEKLRDFNLSLMPLIWERRRSQPRWECFIRHMDIYEGNEHE